MNNICFAGTYKSFELVLNQSTNSLLVFDGQGEEFMKIHLITEDDLVKAICVVKSIIDDHITDKEKSKTLFG